MNGGLIETIYYTFATSSLFDETKLIYCRCYIYSVLNEF